jgi:type I restriction enzyme S subunit
MRVDRNSIDEYPIQIPPRNEQEEIINHIDGLFSKLDKGVSELTEARKRLETYRHSLLNHSTSGELTKDWRNESRELTSTLVEINGLRDNLVEEKGTPKLKNPESADNLTESPSSWEVGTVEQLIYSTRYGTSEKCDYDYDGVPVLRIPNIQDGTITLDDLKYASSEADLSNIDPLEPGDFLMVRTNGSSDLIGRAAVVNEEFDEPTYFASYLIRFIVTVRINYP